MTSSYLVLGSIPHKLLKIIPGDQYTNLEDLEFQCPFDLTRIAEINGSGNLINHLSQLFPSDLLEGWFHFTIEIAKELQVVLSAVEQKYLVSASSYTSELSDGSHGYVTEYDLDDSILIVSKDFPNVTGLPVGSVLVRNSVVYELVYVDGFKEVIPVWLPIDR
jgi:hypothetical protein